MTFATGVQKRKKRRCLLPFLIS